MNRDVDMVSLSQTRYARTLRQDRERIDHFVEFEVRPSRFNFLRDPRPGSFGARVERGSVYIIVTGCAFLVLVGLSNLLHR